jgi:hypothetical protein
MEGKKEKKVKTPKKVAAADADGDDTEFMIQPEKVAPRIDTSK